MISIGICCKVYTRTINIFCQIYNYLYRIELIYRRIMNDVADHITPSTNERYYSENMRILKLIRSKIHPLQKSRVNYQMI
jgi:hypothetical protein